MLTYKKNIYYPKKLIDRFKYIIQEKIIKKFVTNDSTDSNSDSDNNISDD